MRTQNAYYNGYSHDFAVNNIVAFALTCKIVHAAMNYPGSWHDYQAS